MESGLVKINLINMRNFAWSNYGSVDDKPVGGGAGMLIRVDVIDHAIESISNPGRIIITTPKGKQFTQSKAVEYSKLKNITILCGHYEGFDQRVHDFLVDEEISVGPFVLTGGEIPGMAVVDAVIRLLPGVIKESSLKEESYTNVKSNRNSRTKKQSQIANGKKAPVNSYFEYPQYTKPREYKGWKVPEVLLSGNHKEIEEWKKENI